MNANNLTVRFAPSPSSTGGIHLGNAKTALFNFLFAAKNKANFVFRIEDTDQARAVPGCADRILEELEWLGIKPTMGYNITNNSNIPYSQMERLSIYQRIAYELVDKGLAYRCYCTQEELDAKRAEAETKNPKAPFKYPGTCKNLKVKLDKPHVLRFKATTEGTLEFEDVTFGKRTVPNKENFDFVILRANGIPLYNFAVVVDDGITDKITHIIRGSDHIKNMSQQLLLYKALGLPTPIFCHLPMLLSSSGAKLSKRDAAVSIADYRNKGYSPGAILNYLVRFGWGYGDQEIFSLKELIEKFKIDNCNCRDGKFDATKFATVNYTHLKSTSLTPDREYAKLLKPFIDAKDIGNFSIEQLIPFVKVVRKNSRTFVEAANYLVPILQNEITVPPELITQTINSNNINYLYGFKDLLTSLTIWNEDYLRHSAQDWLKTKNLALKDIDSPLRTILLGKKDSPEIFLVLSALGKDKSINRLQQNLSQIIPK